LSAPRASSAQVVGALWLNPVDGNWTDPTKWSTDPFYPNNGSPAATTYDADIGAVGPVGTSYAVSLSAPVSVGTVTIDTNQATLAIASGATLNVGTRLTSFGTIAHSGGTVALPTTFQVSLAALVGSSVYQHTGGTFNFGASLTVGVLAGDTARYEISGPAVLNGVQLNVGGNVGNGTFLQNGGNVQLTTVTGTSGQFPYLALGDDANNSSTVRGYYSLSAGTLTTLNEYVGGSGIGTFVQSGGYNLIPAGITNFLDLGEDATANGTYQLSGGTLQTAALVLAHFGSGTFLHTGGNSTISGVLRAGRDAGSKGYYALSGASSVLTSNGEVDVGMDGFGTFVQSGGTYNATNLFYIAKNGSSRGSYTLSGGTLAINALTNNGAFLASGGVGSIGTVNGTGSLTVNGTANVGVRYIRQSAIAVGGNATLTVRPNGTAANVSIVDSSLSMSPGAGTLDLNDNDLVISLGSLGNVSALIANARNGGAWDQPGLTSSSARGNPNGTTNLGSMTGLDYTTTTLQTLFDNVTVAPTDVLVKYTWNGDANFSGTVDFDDYVRVDVGFNTGLTGWSNGDFNYSGSVNFDDYVLIDVAFNTQSGTLGRAVDYLSGDDRSSEGLDDPAVRVVLEHFSRFGLRYASRFLAAIPEPGVTVGLILPFTALLNRRRRLS
jgi:hypothetical protein